jgi:hypothetical protein
MFLLIIICAVVAHRAALVLREFERERTALREMDGIATAVKLDCEAPRWLSWLGFEPKCFERVRAMSVWGDCSDVKRLGGLSAFSEIDWLDLKDPSQLYADSDPAYVKEHYAFVEGAVKVTAQLPSLRRMNISFAGTDTNIMRHIFGQPALRHLRAVVGTDGTQACLAGISRLRHLESLILHRFQISESEAAEIAKLTSLRELDLAECAVGDAALRHLARLRHLRKLYLAGCPLTDQGVESLAQLGSLESLWLASCPISDGALAVISTSGLQNTLRELSVDFTPITDGGVAMLRNCRNLQYLSLQDTEVTAACLPDLAAIPALARSNVELRDTYADVDGTGCLKAFYNGATLQQLQTMVAEIQAKRDAAVHAEWGSEDPSVFQVE